jgi:hypothetical protein
MKTCIFWDIPPFSLFKVDRRFGATYRLHLQGRRKSQARNQRERKWQTELYSYLLHPGFLLGLFLTLKMEEIFSSETSADFERTTRRYIPERINLMLFYSFSRNAKSKSSQEVVCENGGTDPLIIKLGTIRR